MENEWIAIFAAFGVAAVAIHLLIIIHVELWPLGHRRGGDGFP
jgi:hypothetical protein